MARYASCWRTCFYSISLVIDDQPVASSAARLCENWWATLQTFALSRWLVFFSLLDNHLILLFQYAVTSCLARAQPVACFTWYNTVATRKAVTTFIWHLIKSQQVSLWLIRSVICKQMKLRIKYLDQLLAWPVSKHVYPFRVQKYSNYSATSNNTKLVHWPLLDGVLHLVKPGGDWAGLQTAQASPRCTKCNSPPVNSQCIPIIVLLYNGSFLCGFNVPIKGLIYLCAATNFWRSLYGACGV